MYLHTHTHTHTHTHIHTHTHTHTHTYIHMHTHTHTHTHIHTHTTRQHKATHQNTSAHKGYPKCVIPLHSRNLQSKLQQHNRRESLHLCCGRYWYCEWWMQMTVVCRRNKTLISFAEACPHLPSHFVSNFKMRLFWSQAMGTHTELTSKHVFGNRQKKLK